MLVFKPNFHGTQLPPPHLMSYLDSFSHTPYAFAYEYDKTFVAFPAQVIRQGFWESRSQNTLEEWIKKIFFATDIYSLKYPPGQFYRRMWRPPGYLSESQLAPDLRIVTQSALAIDLLIERVRELFMAIEPVPENLSTFGHKIREVLLLACMEVETSWAGVLRAHDCIKVPYTTNDYVKLLEPMCLTDYQVHLKWYPDFPPFKPFEAWSVEKPTQSLSWYEAYNATKHDRESNLSQATLGNALHAVGAAIVMFFSQFGPPERGESLSQNIYSMFNIILNNSHPERSYLPLGISTGIYATWTPVKYEF